MKKRGLLMEEIHHALPDRTPGAIQVQYSTKLKKIATVEVMAQTPGNFH
jgi:hypothetical protein